MSSLKTTNILNPSSTTNNIVLAADGSTTISTLTATTIQGTIKSGTAKAYNWNGVSTNTFLDFESIPSWVKRITVMFNGVSTNGSSAVQIQIGAGSFTTSGYIGYATRFGVTPNNVYTAMSAGFVTSDNQASTTTRFGVFYLVNVSSNNWNLSGSHTNSATNGDTCLVNGTLSLSGTLDRIRITTVNGTDTFDAGTVNILYEG
jgi:hypothetical protein